LLCAAILSVNAYALEPIITSSHQKLMYKGGVTIAYVHEWCSSGGYKMLTTTASYGISTVQMFKAGEVGYPPQPIKCKGK
jgi:hypothetical protein